MLQFDRQLTISAAGNRWAERWPSQTLWWSEMVQRLAVPVRGTETLTAYLRMPKKSQDQLKDVGGFVAGELRGGVRKNSAVISRDVVTLDMDAVPAGGTDDLLRRVQSLGCASCVYSTRKHEPAKPRLRVLIPLAQTVSADQYEPIARKLAEMIGIGYCDPTTFQPVRMMYWPSACADAEYIYTFTDAPLASGSGILALYRDWTDVSSWPQVPGQQQAYRTLADKQEDPTTKRGIVGAFCRVYNIYQAIDQWLPGVYTPVDTTDGRFTYASGSTTGGAVVYDDGKFLFSHHGTDPAGGKLVNSFDLVRLHKYGDLDDNAKPETPANRLPSYEAMTKAAMEDPVVRQLLLQERHDQAAAEFSSPGTDLNWLAKLELTSSGGYARTIDNVVMILQNDDGLRDRLRFEEFSNRFVISASMPWDENRTYTQWRQDGTRNWTDADDMALCRYVEKVYRIGSERAILAAVDIVARDRGYNAVVQYLQSLTWDGERRLDTLLIDYFAAEDCAYVRTVTRKAFTAAVARAMDPGCKFDNVLTLVGPQGIFKSTLLRRMGKSWFSDSLSSFDGKEAMELIQGSWIMELSELESLNKSESTTVKQFLSRVEDIYREPYGRRTQAYPRRCVFFGTTNEQEFLKDSTGNRRFWPVAVPGGGRLHVARDLPVDQIWAEALVNWKLGEPLYLSREEEEIAKEQQARFRVSDSKEGMIREFLQLPITENWDKLTISQHRTHYATLESKQAMTGLIPRRKVCAMEILAELFDAKPGLVKQRDTREINAILDRFEDWRPARTRFGEYGLQRGYVTVCQMRVTDTQSVTPECDTVTVL